MGAKRARAVQNRTCTRGVCRKADLGEVRVLPHPIRMQSARRQMAIPDLLGLIHRAVQTLQAIGLENVSLGFYVLFLALAGRFLRAICLARGYP